MRACGYVQCGVDSFRCKNDLVGGDLPGLLLPHEVVPYVVTHAAINRRVASTAFHTAQGTIRATHEGQTQTEQQVTLPCKKDTDCVPEIIEGETRTIGRAL